MSVRQISTRKRENEEGKLMEKFVKEKNKGKKEGRTREMVSEIIKIKREIIEEKKEW